MRLRTIDLFCGAGGSSWGAKNAGAELVAAFDKWDLAGQVYQDNFPGVRFYQGDLKDADAHQLKQQLGTIELLLASPECTNHSVAKGAAPRCEKSRETAFHILRFAEAFQPRWVVVENVVSMRNWRRYCEFLLRLRDLGYHPLQKVFDASDFGVPQARRRMFILCDRERQPTAAIPLQGDKKAARIIIRTNGKYEFSPLRSERRASATLERADRAIAVLGRNEPFLLVYYGSDHAGGWQSLDRPLRTITTLDRFAYVKPNGEGHIMRMLQPEELKLAMGWPQSFHIGHGTRREKIKMIGNAVSPKVMRAVVAALCKDTEGQS